ncbi:hypothetical protein GWI33_022330 [Rhynchophorus ferrugineus]|uniref:Uncharacterized protein n=1 Tax=Rhynchophorus ferrugineus TaxID=354439 RepID=A0A834IUX7_RHYFE|nr:hypothetical protein GWI33_022330 [Rhynchophorus ferrugineus]
MFDLRATYLPYPRRAQFSSPSGKIFETKEPKNPVKTPVNDSDSRSLAEVAGDNHNQVNWKQMNEDSCKEGARLQEQVAHLSSQIEVLTKTIQVTPADRQTKHQKQARQNPASSTEPALHKTSAWGNGGGRRLVNNLANSGQAVQQAKTWIPQSQLEELKQSVLSSAFRANCSNVHACEWTLGYSDP